MPLPPSSTQPAEGLGASCITRTGAVALDLPRGVVLGPESEEGYLTFDSPAMGGVVRLATFYGMAPELVDQRLAGPQASPEVVPLPCGEARYAVGAERPAGGGVELRVRRWLLQRGTLTVHVVHELPEALGGADDAVVDAMLASLRFRDALHPALEPLLAALNEPLQHPLWSWRAEHPLRLWLEHPTHHDLSIEVGAVVDAAALSEASLLREVERYRKVCLRLCMVLGLQPADPEVLLDGAFPLVRREHPVDVARPAGLDPKHVPSWERDPWGDGWSIYYALRFQGFWWYLERADLERWGLSPEATRQAALRNLQALGAPSVVTLPGGGSLLWEEGHGLAASYLLVPAFVQSLERKLGSQPHISLPTAGVAVASRQGLGALSAVLDEDILDAYLAEPTSQTPAMYALTSQGLRGPAPAGPEGAGTASSRSHALAAEEVLL